MKENWIVIPDEEEHAGKNFQDLIFLEYTKVEWERKWRNQKGIIITLVCSLFNL